MEKDYLIKKWLSNELSEAEAEAFRALDEAKLCEEIIEEAQRFKGDTQAQVPTFAELNQVLPSKKKVIPMHWTKIASSIAAIFVIGMVVFSLFNKDNMSIYKTDYAQNEIITLPDNSIVNLNQLSQLKYNASGWDEYRSLTLNGEAFFNVEKGKRFEVETKQGTISVLGTEFNVLSRDSIFKVSCFEGLVKVSYNNKEVKLPAGSEFILKTGDAKKNTIVTAEPYWIKEMSVFKNATIDDVFKELERQYNVSVSHTLTSKLHFTGGFEHNNLENALKSITQPFDLTYIVKNNKDVIIKNVSKE